MVPASTDLHRLGDGKIVGMIRAAMLSEEKMDAAEAGITIGLLRRREIPLLSASVRTPHFVKGRAFRRHLTVA